MDQPQETALPGNADGHSAEREHEVLPESGICFTLLKSTNDA